MKDCGFRLFVIGVRIEVRGMAYSYCEKFRVMSCGHILSQGLFPEESGMGSSQFPEAGFDR